MNHIWKTEIRQTKSFSSLEWSWMVFYSTGPVGVWVEKQALGSRFFITWLSNWWTPLDMSWFYFTHTKKRHDPLYMLNRRKSIVISCPERQLDWNQKNHSVNTVLQVLKCRLKPVSVVLPLQETCWKFNPQKDFIINDLEQAWECESVWGDQTQINEEHTNGSLKLQAI